MLRNAILLIKFNEKLHFLNSHPCFSFDQLHFEKLLKIQENLAKFKILCFGTLTLPFDSPAKQANRVTFPL